MSYWSPAEPRNAHLLVVDDNIDELKLLMEALRDTGYRITLAFDALEGYRRATALRTDLVLLDVRMGATDGFATCRLLKANPATADIPVIFVTASAAPQERLLGLRSGAVDYILKPFDPAEVLARVEIHLALAERRTAGDAAARVERPQLASGTASDESANMDRALVRAVERLVLFDLGTVPSLRELASQVGTHEKRLSRVFKERTGRTVFEFVREARLHEAQRLLAGSAMRIEEIAAAVGFSSAANFATAFREHFDCTPTAFRQVCTADPAAPREPQD
ncbi:DNA-binding response regulator [Variovorax sp. M-6]|uniref:response regulator transcription factor n=1 Tax=Variovorax sp. M-6 TaxID=3233041 RepID=UPI003F9AD2D0